MSTFSLFSFLYLYICTCKQNEKCLCLCGGYVPYNFDWIHLVYTTFVTKNVIDREGEPQTNWKKKSKISHQIERNWCESTGFRGHTSKNRKNTKQKKRKKEAESKSYGEWVSEHRDVWPFVFFCPRLFAFLFPVVISLAAPPFLRHWRHHTTFLMSVVPLLLLLLFVTRLPSAIITCWFHGISWTYARCRLLGLAMERGVRCAACGST